MLRSQVMVRIQEEFARLNAATVADLLISPFIDATLLVESTAEQGPSMWIVNRSDVYDETLTALKNHSIAAIADRAAEKLRQRHSSLVLLEPPELEGPLEEVPEYMVEDVLGHPLCPFEAQIFFTHAPNEDHRASAALSLTRRLLEHAPNWNVNLKAKQEISDAFAQMLLSDPSPYTRSYTARVPLLSTSVLQEALSKETHDLVCGRLLQNPATSTEMLEWAAENFIDPQTTSFAQKVLALDSRLDTRSRSALLQRPSTDVVAKTIHEWYLSA